jgi:two-component system KDP operon response regulator KdpE
MATEPLVLVVDDDAGIRRLIRLELSSQDFRVIEAPDGVSALHMVESESPNLVVLDIMMPDMTGLEVLDAIRRRRNVPVLLLTGRDQDADKVRGLELGADDYLVKPFNPEELSARVRAILRRSTPAPKAGSEVVTVANIDIDLGRRLVKKDGVVVSLTRTEWILLQHLAMNRGRTILNRDLLTKVWGPEFQEDLQYLRVWVSRLRSKLEADPSKPVVIKTLAGVGYQLGGDEEPAEAPSDSTETAALAMA